MKTIIFDFGNVIGFFDHHKTLRRLAQHTRLTAEEMMARFRATSLEDDYERGAISTAVFLGRIRRHLELSCSAEEIAAAWSDIFHLNEPMHDLVASLSGRCQLLLASNTNELHALQFRQQFAGTLRHFHHLVLSHEIGARKPCGEFFAHCQRHSDGAADECLFIDDLPANVAGAQRHGWHGIVYQEHAQLRDYLKSLGFVSASY